VVDKRHALIADPSSQTPRRPRDPDQAAYASGRGYEHESGQNRSWNWFGGGGGWGPQNTFGGSSGPFGGGPTTGQGTSGPSTSGQGGGFWRR
jgi:hypothetical protein